MGRTEMEKTKMKHPSEILREQERLKVNQERGEPALFIFDEDFEAADKGLGVGYWVKDGFVVGVRKYVNGYELGPCFIMEQSFCRTLADLKQTK